MLFVAPSYLRLGVFYIQLTNRAWMLPDFIVSLLSLNKNKQHYGKNGKNYL